MRRTHVMHKRDNRRSFPSHAQRESELQAPRDSRMICWDRCESGRQILLIDGRAFADVYPFGDGRYDMLGEWTEPHIARMSDGTEHHFNSCDAARLFCERLAAG